MIRILHAADLHLDSPFNALSEEKAALRRREQRELLRSLARIRAEQNASLVLLSGDLFDSDSTWAETEELLRLTLSDGGAGVHRAWQPRLLRGERPLGAYAPARKRARLHLRGLRRRGA